LFSTEGIEVEFTPDGIEEIACLTEEMNFKLENLGARRLYTVVEKLFNSLSYDASHLGTDSILIDKKYVTAEVGPLLKEGEFAQYGV